MTLLVALVLVVPFAAIVATLADSRVSFLTTAASVVEQGPPAPPHWAAGLPLVGESLAFYWQSSVNNVPAIISALEKLIGPATDLAAASGTALAQAFVAAIGFWIADVPQPFLLGFLTSCLVIRVGGSAGVGPGCAVAPCRGKRLVGYLRRGMGFAPRQQHR